MFTSVSASMYISFGPPLGLTPSTSMSSTVLVIICYGYNLYVSHIYASVVASAPGVLLSAELLPVFRSLHFLHLITTHLTGTRVITRALITMRQVNKPVPSRKPSIFRSPMPCGADRSVTSGDVIVNQIEPRWSNHLQLSII